MKLVMTYFTYWYEILAPPAVSVNEVTSQCQLRMLANLLDVMNGREQPALAVLALVVSRDLALSLTHPALVVVVAQYLRLEL